MAKQRQTETKAQGAERKKTMQECVTKQRQTETEEQGAKRKKTMRECVTKQRQTETEEQGAKRKKTDCDRKTNNGRLKQKSKVLNARRLNGTV